MDLIMISGPMGVGKTVVAKELNDMLSKSIVISGDDCWKFNPKKINDRTKKRVLKNIVKKLNNCLDSNEYDYVIFEWVMMDEEIKKAIISKLSYSGEVISFTLICSPEALQMRLEQALESHERDSINIEKSLQYLEICFTHSDILIDTSTLSPTQVAQIIERNI